ncbi:MAG TPA: hypothetical protein VF796_27545 [Humisphaera sp.]
MNQQLLQRLVRRLGVVGLAVVLMAAAAGLFYVARLTQLHGPAVGGSRPSPLVLFALAGLAGIAGVGTLRFATHRDETDAD